MSQGTKRPIHELSDEKIIEVISKSIGQILRLSPNEDFRRKSFEMLKGSSTKEVEEHISKRLTSILTEKNSLAKKKRKKKSKVEYTPEVKSSDLFSLMDIAEAYDLADSVILEKICQIENISEGGNNLLIDLNKKIEVAGLVTNDNNNIPENISKEAETCHDIDILSVVTLDEEKDKSLQNSPLREELFDKNWLEVTIKKCKNKPNDNYSNKDSNLTQVTNSNDFCINSQISEDSYSQNLYDSQNFSQQENFLARNLSDSQKDGIHESDFQEMFKSECRNYLNVNVKRKNLD